MSIKHKNICIKTSLKSELGAIYIVTMSLMFIGASV